MIKVIILLIIIVIIKILLLEHKPEINEKDCSLHDWTYNKDDRLFCAKCGKIANPFSFKNNED